MNVMSSVTAPPRRGQFSRAEFMKMLRLDAFDDIAVELVEGELHRMPPPGNPHRRLQMAVLARLLRLLDETLVCAEVGIDLGNDTIVAADAAVLKAPFDGEGMIPAAAIALVIEVAVSTRDRDLGLKRKLYAAAGIPTYWVVDADRGVTHVFDRPEGDDYMGLALARFGEPLTVPGTDGVVVLG